MKKTDLCVLILCVIVLFSSIVDTSDIVPDVTVIYSLKTSQDGLPSSDTPTGEIARTVSTEEQNATTELPRSSDEDISYDYADLEVHVGPNSIGKLFILDNGTVLVPDSSQSIRNLQCIYADHDANCKWTLNGAWEKKDMTPEDVNALSLKTPGQSLMCENNNGGCEMLCNNTMNGPKCSCPSLVLNGDGRTCSSNSNNVHILRSSSGTIQSPYYPSNYPHNIRVAWIILAPRNHKIVLTITSFRTEENYDFLSIQSNDVSARLHGTTSRKMFASESRMMTLIFTTDGSNNFFGFSAQYKIVPHSRVMSKILVSSGGSSTLELPLNIVPTNLCLSVVYNLLQSAALEVLIQHESSKYVLSSSQTYEEKEWKTSLFTLPSEFNETEKHMNVIVKCSVGPCKIANIADCSHQGEVYSLGSRKWIGKNVTVFDTATPEDRKNCSNGGFFNSTVNICLCPPGFTGNRCEETCGPNRFGDKCNSVCSSFNKGCKNMIFCNSANKCMCASGFRGEACEEECINENVYGSMCSNDCGECIDGICDKFTGECILGCRNGYYPPNCQERYLTLKNPPRIYEKSWFNVSMGINPKHVHGKGKPHLYSVQHKVKESNIWLTSIPLAVNNEQNITVNLTGLKAGTNYTARVILISDDGNSYQGSHVPEIEFYTSCEVPDTESYEINIRNVTKSSFTVEWKHKMLSDKWCPVLSYDLILQDSWRKFYRKISSQDDLYSSYYDLWPGQQYTISICAWTHWGRVPCSSPSKITTLEEAPGKVKYLSVQSRSARNIHISWKRPLFSGGVIKGYKIQYQCLKYFSCNATCENSNGTIETTQTSTIIAGLLPYSQYIIRVAAFTVFQGPFSSVYSLTNPEKPDNAPMASKNYMINKSNSSVTVQWKPPQCFGLNGNFQGYFYTLSTLQENGTIANVTFSGSTMDTNTTITDLLPKTDYELHIHTMNSLGWNPYHKLQIFFSTTATVPDAVTNLEVYKSGRRMLGIRWGKPSKPYGELKSFTVTYRKVGEDLSINETILPTPCPSWPDLYCHTINSSLQPEKIYSVTVRARNKEIDEDGIASEITAICREYAPDAPSYLRILKTDSSSFEMEWGVPKKFNGELRSFLVNVEHIDAANESVCCEYFPVQELSFREENSLYSLVVDGLIPASTYITSVSAKTVLLGPSVNITFSTPPEPITNLRSPQITKVSNGSYSVQLFKPSVIIHSRINSVLLLLVLHDNLNITSDIWYTDVKNLLSKAVARKFYIASEILFEEGESEKMILIGTGKNVQNGTIGEIRDPGLIPGDYQVGVALLQSFGDAASVSFKASNNFRAF